MTSPSAAHLLIVDDERSMRELLEYMLTREGYTISLAENGRKAVEMVTANDYDLILCDIRLGDITGLEVTLQDSRCCGRPNSIRRRAW